MASQAVIKAIDESPLNRGLRGIDWVSNPANIAIEHGDDIILFDYEGDAVYQIHVLLKSRGLKALHRVRAAFAEMFLIIRAEMIFGLVPEFRRDVKIFARWCGMKFAGLRQTENGPCELYVLSKDMWKVKR